VVTGLAFSQEDLMNNLLIHEVYTTDRLFIRKGWLGFFIVRERADKVLVQIPRNIGDSITTINYELETIGLWTKGEMQWVLLSIGSEILMSLSKIGYVSFVDTLRMVVIPLWKSFRTMQQKNG
jgi:hypothetical protein